MQGDSSLSLAPFKVQGGFSSGSVVKEDPLEKEGATYSSILAWEIPRTEMPDRLTVYGIPELDMN